jgi:putative thioredoxin
MTLPLHSAPENVFDTHLEHFDRDVIEASHALPILVDFWADWCPPCRALTPVLERVVAQLDGRIRMAKIEVDEGDNMKLAGRYGLRGFPTVLLFIKGEIIGRFSSAKPEHWVREFIAEHAGIE